MQLDPESRADVEAYKTSITPDQARRDTNWESIARRALRGDAPEWVDDDDVVPGRRRRTLAWVIAGTAAVAAAVVLMVMFPSERLHGKDAATASSASYESRQVHDDLQEAAVRIRRPDEPTPVELPTMDEPHVDVDAAKSPDEAPDQKPRRKPRRSLTQREEGPAGGDSLADIRAESVLVGRARAALRDHDPKTASRLLDEHARKFPSGELEQERELLRVVTACEKGESQAAVRAANSFRTAFPSSPLLSHLESTCAGAR